MDDVDCGEQVAAEIAVLRSIYGDDAITAWTPPSEHTRRDGTPRYVISLALPSYETVFVRVLVSAPPSYPASTPPQLQLLSRYLGPFGTDAALFASVLRTFMSSSGVQWCPDALCVFDGLQNVLERCERWYDERLAADKAARLAREESSATEPIAASQVVPSCAPPQRVSLPDGLQIFEAEAIVDRKSIFIGRACRISHPSQVPSILDHIRSDKHVARATHPTINAWRCTVDEVLHQDNDDDGETAAGSRLAHLLSILEIDGVLVVVTRWFGGVHLGPDRFKHINHAARNAIEAAGFLDDTKKGGKGPSKGRKR